MLRAVWFLLKMALLVAAIGWLAQYPGDISITWLGYEITTTVGVALALVVFLIVFFTYLDRFWRAFVAIPENLRRRNAAARREKGYRILTEGLVAVAAGDARGAERSAEAAEKMVPDTPLTKLLSAQAALLGGNAPKARREFMALLDDGDAAFFGLRGLLTEAVRDEDYAEALRLIRKAEELQPNRNWVVRTRFDMEVRNRHWKEAAQVLKKAQRLGALDAATARRHKMALDMAQAEAALGIGDASAARRFAEHAFAEDNGFSPAALLLSRLYHAADKDRAARKTLERAWEAAPHPDLALAWRALMPPSKKTLSVYERGKDMYEWVGRLAAENAGHRESHRMLGQAALEASLWQDARRHLTQAGDYKMLARLERAETGSDQRAREWLEKLADMPLEPQWSCTACGHAAPGWTPLCTACGAFDTQEWSVPQVDAHRPQRQIAAAAAGIFEGDIISPPQRA
jgi:HemY protein